MDVWNRIFSTMKSQEKNWFRTLSERSSFLIHSVNEDDIIIEFESENVLRLAKWRFEEVYNRLPYDEWVPIGASRINTNPYSVEGFMKSRLGNMNALSTATWVAKILVYCGLAEFNGRSRGQAIRKIAVQS